MPVAPHHASVLQDRTNLHQFLLFCQQKAIEKNHPQIANISLAIDPIDPLMILQEFLESNQVHFYLEKSLSGEAIAAIGSAISYCMEGDQRFLKSQNFIESCQSHIISNGAGDLPVPSPRFFCSFTFFDHNSAADAPFPAATVFLPQWQVIRQQSSCYFTANVMVYPNLDLDNSTEIVWKQFQKIRAKKYSLLNRTVQLKRQLNQWRIVDTESFGAIVLSALNAIRNHHLNKIVLAHAIDVFSSLPLQWMRSLQQLRQLHPDCYMFSTGNGQGQSFIGASPERLISIRNHCLITDALAGSAPRGQGDSEDRDLAQRLLHSEKERHEHQVVVDFIMQRLLHLGVLPQFSRVPGLLRLSNIQHLHTPLQAILPTTLHPLVILAELHPTPAVAGVPRELACQLIRRYEQFERSLYAAPLGWVDAQGNAEFIVGIRSALIEEHHARLYAGAGIVAGSAPEREMAEIQLKFQTLLQALV